MSGFPVVDVGKCAGSEECVDICPEDCFMIENDKATVIHGDNCLGFDCGMCIENCENDAIELA